MRTPLGKWKSCRDRDEEELDDRLALADAFDRLVDAWPLAG